MNNIISEHGSAAVGPFGCQKKFKKPDVQIFVPSFGDCL